MTAPDALLAQVELVIRNAYLDESHTVDDLSRSVLAVVVDACAQSTYWLDKTGGEYARGYNAAIFDSQQRIRSLAPITPETTK